jgi:Spy/CpxP family protein refolding chaperone
MQRHWNKGIAAVAVMLATAMIIATNATANRHGGRSGHASMLGKVERGVENLELAPEARKSIDAILDQARTERRPLRDQLRAAHEQMRTTLDAESPSSDTVLAQADTIGALETQAKKRELQALIEVRQLLTAEQWRQLRTQRRPGRACHHGHSEKPS